ncbi:hypothetical protein GCM10023195_76600 [Actinoallomurus liliacearum]|uniref:Uncharacterized protein n=1 Tax=Actinoallomurus liliacearum TaxID=1080073 RepID=A0ABP8TV38_9ACTN
MCLSSTGDTAAYSTRPLPIQTAADDVLTGCQPRAQGRAYGPCHVPKDMPTPKRLAGGALTG